jgi:dimethylhistidine N-methyltransferase
MSASHAARAAAPRNIRIVDLAPAAPSLLAEVVAGLERPHKTLPPKLFYDARGAELFNRICETQAYYLTRTELAILKRYASGIAARVGSDATIVEPGAGDMRKIRLLLPLLRPRHYVPVDISADQLRSEGETLALELPWLQVSAVVADFLTSDLERIGALAGGRRVLFFPGSTIGNFEPDAAEAFLRRARQLVGDGGGALVGVDLRKPKAVLDLAYNDPEGYTAQFNLNILARINRDLGANFDLRTFAHRAFYEPSVGRIEMHLVSLHEQCVAVGERHVHFAPGETIHTESSYKYTPDGFGAMARKAGFAASQMWTDPHALFGVFYLFNH